MMKPSITLIFVEIEGGVNLGLICRLADNFDVDQIRLVNPQLSDEDYDLADVFASRASHRLESLKLYSSLEDAIEDLDLVFGTSGVVSNSYPWRHIIDVRDFQRILKKIAVSKLGIVFGRESTGLNIEEIELLDFIVRIPTSPNYPSLNLATSVAIILSNMYNLKLGKPVRRLNPEYIRLISKYVYESALSMVKKDVLAKSIASSIKKAIALSNLSPYEVKMIITWFRRIYAKERVEFKG